MGKRIGNGKHIMVNRLRGVTIMTQSSETNPQFTPAARKHWEGFSEYSRQRILETCWCVKCRTSVTLKLQKARAERGLIILEGVCGSCGGVVVRTVELD
jgi:hypothetical protein